MKRTSSHSHGSGASVARRTSARTTNAAATKALSRRGAGLTDMRTSGAYAFGRARYHPVRGGRIQDPDARVRARGARVPRVSRSDRRHDVAVGSPPARSLLGQRRSLPRVVDSLVGFSPDLPRSPPP